MTSETFNTIFLGCKDRAMRFAWSITGNRQDAEDIVQDVYEKLWRRRLLIRDTGLPSLIMTSVRNAAIDRTRRLKPMPLEGSQESSAQNPDTALLDQLYRAISLLPEAQRNAVTLHDIEGMEIDEIAALTGVSTASVRMALSRGRNTLRNKLTKIINYGVEEQK
ncbi:MAG: RNA polymerase sigma factor [Rikenellaceae bacterium]|nr:RNA polymerase sigma factor [Rikenellaceae bacterium]